MAEDVVEFEEPVRGRSPALLRTASLPTGDRGYAENLLQEVFVQMYARNALGPCRPECDARPVDGFRGATDDRFHTDPTSVAVVGLGS